MCVRLRVCDWLGDGSWLGLWVTLPEADCVLVWLSVCDCVWLGVQLAVPVSVGLCVTVMLLVCVCDAVVDWLDVIVEVEDCV